MANLEETVPSDQDEEYSVDLFSYEEVQCHMDRLEWDQARLKEDVGRTCPPFWDRQEDQQFKLSIPVTPLKHWQDSKTCLIKCLHPATSNHLSPTIQTADLLTPGSPAGPQWRKEPGQPFLALVI